MQETGFIVAAVQIRVFSMLVRFTPVRGTAVLERAITKRTNQRKQDGESAAAGEYLCVSKYLTSK